MFRSKRLFDRLSALPLGGNRLRVKIPLPSIGECWFTFKNSETMETITAEILQEIPDSRVRTTYPRLTLKEALEQQSCEVVIDNNPFKIETKYEVLEQSTLLKSFVDSLVRFNPKSKKEMNLGIQPLLKTLGEKSDLISKDISNQLNEINSEIDKIKAVHSKLTKRARRIANLWGFLGLGYMMSQWTLFYVTIFQIEWLGWDLMEPITYSIGQGTFVFSLFYYLRNRKDHTYSNVLYNYEKRKMDRSLMQYNIDVGSYERLLEEQARLKSKLELIEKKLNY